MYAPILAHIAQYVSLNNQEQEIFCAALLHKRFRKHQYILQEGEQCQYDHFVIKGSLRQYEVSEDGKENVVQFGFENWWMTDWHSILTNTPSVYNIDALEDTEVLLIEKDRLEQLFKEIPSLEIYFRKILLHAFSALQRRVLYLQKPADERYTDFFNRYAYFEQRLSQQHIASYLGITRETLSRLKSQQVKPGK